MSHWNRIASCLDALLNEIVLDVLACVRVHTHPKRTLSICQVLRVLSSLSHPLLIALLLSGTHLFMAGCNAVPTAAEKPLTSSLGLAPLGEDAVALDTCSIVLDDSHAGLATEIWQNLDEQFLSPEQRTVLSQNGFRCGLVGMNLPPCLLALVDDSAAGDLQSEEKQAGTSPKLSSDDRQGQRLKISEGRETILVTSETQPEVTILVSEEGKVVGKVFRDAQTVLSLNTRSVGDGDIEITLIPEIHHGPHRQRIVGSQGALRMESSREREVFSRLNIKARLSPGQTIVVSSVGPEASLGGRFFGGNQRRKWMLIRLASPRQDRLFNLWTQHDQESADKGIQPDM